MVQVRLSNIVKKYGEATIVKGIDLDVADKELIVLVGPSGCGKSTTLRMIAGLEEITGGDLYIGENKVNHLSPGDRGVAMVFQDYALYPHMSVYENLAFSLRLKRFKKAEIDARVREAANMLDLELYLERKPKDLSGGQRQRVAMGRAIVKKSSVFLFDEPLSNLDAKLRSKMRGEIKRFHMKTKTTTLYVTHDQLEAMTLADRLVVMKDGIIQQIGTPMEVFRKPQNVFVATFIGSPSMNLLKVNAVKKDDGFYLNGHDDRFNFKISDHHASVLEDKMEVTVGIRPSDVHVQKENAHAKGTVEMIELLGKNAYVTIRIGDYECMCDIHGRDLPSIGDEIDVSFNLDHIHLFDSKTENNLHV